jgi:hypothetical protein
VSLPSTTNIDVATQILTALGQVGAAGAVPGDGDALSRSLRACSRDQLLGFARQLGISGVTKLAKDPLAGRVAAALDALRTPVAGAEAAEVSETATGPLLPAKFDLGHEVTDKPAPDNIPWGYGADRVTAMSVDPKKLFVYWEVTDAAIAAARKNLGGGGAGAWLNVRVYDISGRLFDGTNAHSYFDHGVDRAQRHWFFEINKPTSTTCVEIGMKSAEGYFVKIARSGRVDFSRDAPQPDGAIEWLTVRTATGPAGAPMHGGAPIPDGQGQGGGGALGGGGDNGWQGWTEGAGFPAPGGVTRETQDGYEWRESVGESYQSELGRYEWLGPVHRSEWTAGPFTYPVDVPSLLEMHESGTISMRSENGTVHVVYGPWSVVIRGAGARAERKVLATWEYRRTVEVQGGFERLEQAGWWEPIAPGASEMRYIAGGASERRWLGSSELLMRGGSEVYMLGASERLLRGASERLYKGASERMYRGASERLMRGASERLYRGASERLVAGAGEARTAGQLGGSENVARSGAGLGGSVDPMTYPRPER